MSAVDKRSQILQVAECLFAQHGFNGTSVRDIADAADVNISMISYYFGSKEGLMQALFQSRTAQAVPAFAQVLHNEELEPIDKIFGLIDAFVEQALEKLRFHKIIITSQMADNNPALMQMIEEMRLKNLDMVRKLLEEGQQKKAFRRDVDPLLFTYTIIGTIIHTYMNLDFVKKYLGIDKEGEGLAEKMVKERLAKHLKDTLKSNLTYGI